MAKIQIASLTWAPFFNISKTTNGKNVWPLIFEYLNPSPDILILKVLYSSYR